MPYRTHLANFVVIVTISLSTASHAEIYRWVDDNGGVHFGSSPPVNQGIVSYEWAADREQKIREAKTWLPQVNFSICLGFSKGQYR